MAVFMLPLKAILWMRGVYYLDPGTGSVILQAAIAVLMSALFFLGLFRKRVSALLGRVFRHRVADPTAEKGQPDDE